MTSPVPGPDVRRVLVGYDGSPDADLALAWGADLAQHSGRRLAVVVARGDLFTVSEFADGWTMDLAREWVAQARTRLAELGVEGTEVEIGDGLPAGVLVEESARASVVVVGGQGHGLVRRTVQGSVSQHVSRHAHCPVVVVRPPRDEASRTVVVGVDGSPESLAALELATEYAGARDLEVMVGTSDDHLSGYTDPRLPGSRPWLIPEIATDLAQRASEVHRLVRTVTDRRPDVSVRVVEWTARPGPALVEASAHAALLVLGSRGLGAFAGLLLGSVSTEVLARAHCPVAVVR